MDLDRSDPIQARAAGFEPGGAVAGQVRVPGSKSIAQRLVAAAAVARGRTRLVGLPSSDDVVGALRCARAMGARTPGATRADDPMTAALLRRGKAGTIEGAPPDPRGAPRPWAVLEPGESGTCARLFSAVAALGRTAGSGAELRPEGTLVRRRSEPLLAALQGAGAGLERGDGPGSWPAMFTAAIPGPMLELTGAVSSQEVSGLLLALAAHAGERRLRVLGEVPSRGYVRLTVEVLERFGGSVAVESLVSDAPDAAGELFTVRGPLAAPAEEVRCEADASAAAVALAAGALSGGAVTEVHGVGRDSSQPDAAILRCLEAFGCSPEGSDRTRLVVQGRPTRGARIDCEGHPDLAPVLAACGAFAAREGLGETRLTGLGTLPGKESDRIAVLAEGLARVGLAVETGPEHLLIGAGSGARAERLELDPHGDHRMAFFTALVSLFEPGVRSLDPGCVAKSWPGFWRDLAAAGGRLSPS